MKKIILIAETIVFSMIASFMVMGEHGNMILRGGGMTMAMEPTLQVPGNRLTGTMME